MNLIWPLPKRGYSEGYEVSETPLDFTGDMNNVRPFDSLERRFRLGQRPGLSKVFDEQMASVSTPIVCIGSISIVDYLGSD